MESISQYLGLFLMILSIMSIIAGALIAIATLIYGMKKSISDIDHKLDREYVKKADHRADMIRVHTRIDDLL